MRTCTRLCVGVLLVLLSCGSAAGQGLKDLGLGAALSLRWYTGADVVTDASIDANGIVRVNTRSNTVPGIMLEGHYLFQKADDASLGRRAVCRRAARQWPTNRRRWRWSDGCLQGEAGRWL